MEQTQFLTTRHTYEAGSFRVKDPISALTHFIGFCASLIGMPLLLLHAAGKGMELLQMASLAVFMFSMILLYGASTAYHTFRISDHGNKVLKKIDHMMIFILIAGSYTPVCCIALSGTLGRNLLLFVWSAAIAGIAFKAFWVTCPRWVSSIIYISMGWLAIFAFGPLHQNLSRSGFAWLLTGGIVYTIGGIIYACKFQLLERYIKGFGAHELFHLFVMGGSFCHFMMMWNFL